MKPFSYLCSALLAALVLPLGALAAGASSPYPDLPKSHWAYEDLDKAAQLGIIKGFEDGRMAPGDTLTWGQYLTMLARSFYPDSYAALLEAGAAWDQAGYWAAWDNGLISEGDFLPVTTDALSSPILRMDVAILLDRALPEDAPPVYGSGGNDWFWDWGWDLSWEEAPQEEEGPAVALPDLYSLPQPYWEPVERLNGLNIVRGKEDNSFGGGDTLQRSDGTALLMRAFSSYEDTLYGEEKAVTLHIVDLQGEPLCGDQVAEAAVGRYLSSLPDTSMLWHYKLNEYQSIDTVSSLLDEYTLVYRPFTRAEAAEADFEEAVQRGELSWDDYYSQDFWLWYQGENPRKSLLLFGNEEQRRFPDRATAEANMTTITVPVWHLDRSGNKVPATATFSIHAAIAQDTTALFTEIYNDPEQFPIHDLGGYGWRGDSATGEHNCGTAVDINANENYQIRDGRILVGSRWAPETDPYSIAPGSSVVRIFAEHGWSWGGDAWNGGDPDDSYGYHDYMHFSYMGM